MCKRAVFGIACLLLAALSAASQDSSTVARVVTDATGATLPLARVMLVDLKTFKDAGN
jgi:hypothetical protein